MARHIEQPGSRHSNPAAIKIRSNPSDSACAFTNPEPGTTKANLILGAICLPLAIAAAARKSSIREFVQEPINTLSILIVLIAVLASKPI